ncbi:cleavage and polyadenylation specificity factor subunit 4-like [Dermatophagoides farinae]|uniref:Cleavage and polyadenylation specificity factor subunit 4 n=1 Tax=Dermatophagoides farinae TaxID=6954 RepID=A0A9D4NPJ8_DERFA|nr:cleavage and polyadenylation specificity factor subunit 4-like [Dermatophagoides farinae]
MEDLVAPIIDIKFDIERDLDEQIGALPLPFPGMDKSGSATCVFHIRGICQRGSMCPYRHIKPDRTVVCKHWLRGLCKKGDSCEFLHEYNMSKMPECYFYSKFRACSNKECPFLHIDPETKIKDCPWYDRGFCRHGPNCRHRHTRRVACLNYLCGFCPDGPGCKFIHMRFDIPISAANSTDPSAPKKPGVICHYCNEVGHKIYTCNQIPPEQRDELIQRFSEQTNQPKPKPSYRPLDQVTCFKCGEKGHYANKCPKGYLAFLSPALKDLHQKRNQQSSNNASMDQSES